MVTEKHEIHCSHDTPISQCLEHWVEFCEIVGDTVEQRALKWLLSNDTGASSRTLCRFMLNVAMNGYLTVPSDADDRGRCIRLLRLIPEWLPRLPELAAAGPGDTKTVNGSEDHKYKWSVQIPLILQEGGF